MLVICLINTIVEKYIEIYIELVMFWPKKKSHPYKYF